MRQNALLFAAAATLGLVTLRVAPVHLHARAQASTQAALTGIVSSDEEGKMEGVVVTARRDGANFAVSVVSDAQGRYSFPRSHLTAGAYAMTIRAVGYDLTDRGAVEVKPGTTANADLKLHKTADLSKQISSIEWAMSVPGTEDQKNMLIKQAESCTYCHSLERIVKSKHTAEEFVTVIKRMASYYPDGTAAPTDGRGRSQKHDKPGLEYAEKNPKWGYAPGVEITDLANYLATINLSSGRALPSELKTLPRPKGKATRVIVTQYFMPRKDTVPHDMEVDSKGTPWYTDESRMFFGKMDPKTGVFTEYPLEPVPQGDIPGARDITMDKEDNPWFPVRFPGSLSLLSKFDVKTGKLSTVRDAQGQFVSTGPDGKIWVGFIRVDPKTMMVDGRFSFNKSPNLPPGAHTTYQYQVNSKGNVYATDFVGSYIIMIDVNTSEAKFWPTPTRNSLPRRGRIDSEDRFWFAEYTGDKLAMFDTRSEKFQEWPVQYKYTTPYTESVPDANGYVYSPSNTSDRLLRLDPKTGEIIEYQMPTNNFDSKKLAIDPISRRAVWMANTRDASLIKLEPID